GFKNLIHNIISHTITDKNIKSISIATDEIQNQFYWGKKKIELFNTMTASEQHKNLYNHHQIKSI
ncbi:hypothetical protein ACR2WG_26530, partial [Klebsiella pneumoniae]